MKIKKIDKHIVQETAGDPAFYNDQIGADKEPIRVSMGIEEKVKTDKEAKKRNK